jgi:c-di-GMP-binding flagellar brake protein YcgR
MLLLSGSEMETLMPSTNKLDPAASRALLRTAAEKNLSLDLVRLLDDGTDTCRSRFVESPSHDLTVEVPTRQGHLLPIHEGEQVEVYFRAADQRYFFPSSVTARTEVPLSNRVNLPVLVLVPPSVVEIRQRRRYYRANMKAPRRLMAQIHLSPEDARLAGKSDLSLEVADLSAGGMRLFFGGTMALCPLQLAQMLTLTFQFDPTTKQPATLQVRVQHVTAFSEGVVHIGLEFVGLGESREGRVLQDRIRRFVAERECDELRRLSELKGSD